MQSHIRTALVLSSLALSAFSLGATTRLEATNGVIRFEVDDARKGEVISLKENGTWIPALTSAASATRVITTGAPNAVHSCVIDGVSRITEGLSLHGDCSVGTFEERIVLTAEPDVLEVQMRFRPKTGAKVLSVEDRYDFAPGRRSSDTPSSGPVDFVWSQNIKMRPMTLFQTGRSSLQWSCFNRERCSPR